jgi:transposase
MEVLYPRCAGLDIHKDTVVACVRCVSKPQRRDVRTFGTTTSELFALAEWLESNGCTHVAMEATGIYWRPVWHVLEGHFELVLANAQHIRNVPGRKTDVNDAAWIADLLAHGLIRSSFVPPSRIQELRDLTRTRKQLVREIAQHTLRIQKTLEDANIKVASVLSNVIGTSGRAMLGAIIAGEEDPERLADLAVGTARRKKTELVEALRGRVTSHHREMIKLHLGLIAALQSALETLDASAGKLLAPIQERAALLTTMPGVSNVVAQVIVAEIGVDMSRFPSAANLVSWAALCPRNDESAGKRRSTRVRKSGTWLKPPWSPPPGPPSTKRTATSKPNSSGSNRGAAPRRPSSPLPHPCSLPATTCSATLPATETSALPTSIAATARRPSIAWCGV